MINESPQDIMIKIQVIDKQAEKKLKKRISITKTTKPT